MDWFTKSWITKKKKTRKQFSVSAQEKQSLLTNRKISAKSEVSITHEQLSCLAKYIETVLRMSRPSFVGSAF